MIPSIAPLDSAWFRRCGEYQNRLTMPAGALGRLLPLGQQLCAIQETLKPKAGPAAIVVMAGDHGVAAQRVSAYPQEVTGQMLANFLRGGAAINVLARRVGARVLVVDMGVKHLPEETVSHPELLSCRLGPGTGDFTRALAMTEEQVRQAFAFSERLVGRLADADVKVLALGEMGIGNTTAAAAIGAALFGGPAAWWTGPGAGLDRHGVAHKAAVVGRALTRHAEAFRDPLEVLRRVGGREIAAMAGALLAARAHRVPVLLDGFVAGAAAALLHALAPDALAHVQAAHLSAEPGHARLLERLQLSPLLQLDMRLGEASGAAVALMLCRAALACHTGMATFAEAGVSSRG
jgi:nicotinate-nucleotide--dimethylbenzimidazole phosphoribosyltransferase